MQKEEHRRKSTNVNTHGQLNTTDKNYEKVEGTVKEHNTMEEGEPPGPLPEPIKSKGGARSKGALTKQLTTTDLIIEEIRKSLQ